MAMFCERAADDPGSALWRDLNPGWGVEPRLLAVIANAARVLVWQNTTDATKKPPRNYPEPILLPGAVNEADGGPPEVTDNTPAGVKHFGTAQMSVAETNEWLGW